MNSKDHRRTIDVCTEIEQERFRQIKQEGFTPAHDDAHVKGEMASAAGNYVAHSAIASYLGGDVWEYRIGPFLNGLGYSAGWDQTIQKALDWPWERKWWKPDTRRRMLIKAAALLVAEIERLDRASEKEQG